MFRWRSPQYVKHYRMIRAFIHNENGILEFITTPDTKTKKSNADYQRLKNVPLTLGCNNFGVFHSIEII